MKIEKQSGCKVNLLLNILGKRADGFHELETVMHPVSLTDDLVFQRASVGIHLKCNDPALPADSGNLVWRAADAFLKASAIRDGVDIELHKKLPLAAGLGGGSANAAVTLLGLNELFGSPLALQRLNDIASTLGSDVPFFLQDKPATATGRGEQIEPLDWFPGLGGKAFLLVHPGFGVSTPWAYQNLARFPEALDGRRGRAAELVDALNRQEPRQACSHFFNSLEAPVLDKYPVLRLYQEFFRENGALGALMSGSGSTTFAIAQDLADAQRMAELFKTKFGSAAWLACVPISRS